MTVFNKHMLYKDNISEWLIYHCHPKTSNKYAQVLICALEVATKKKFPSRDAMHASYVLIMDHTC